MGFIALDEQPVASAKKNRGFVPIESDPAEGATLNVAGFDTGIGISPTIARGLAGAGKAFIDAGRGLGLVDSADEGTKAAEKRLMDTTAGKVGNFAGSAAILAPTALIPGANTAGGAAIIGGVSNALLNEGDLSDRLKSGAIGAIAGAGGQAAMNGIARVVRPNTSAEARKLLDEGVSLTPGQILGGGWKRTEDALTSIPILGDSIKSAQRRGIEDFNRVAIGRAVDPIGGQVSGVGREAVASAKQQLGQAYDNLLPTMQADTLENQFVQNLANLRGMAQSLPSREAQQFDSIIEREIGERLANNGVLSGDNLKAAQAGMRNQAEGFATATDGYQRQLGQALKQAEQELRDLVMRSNPSKAAELAKINEGYANFKRLQRAAASVGAEDGIFTPAQLQNAVKAADKSKDKARFAQGDAMMQDLTDAGKAVLSQRVPDSGTPMRSVVAALGGAGVGGVVAPGATLTAGLGALLGTAAYSKVGTKTLQKLLAERPEFANELAALIRKNGLIASTAGGAQVLAER